MKIKALEFEAGELKLRGRLYEPAKPKPLAVLFIHGWTGLPNEDAAKFLAQNGYTAMTFSLSGHNDSEGKIEDQTRRKSLAEVLAAHDLLKSRLPKSADIVAIGNSYGSYLAILLSAERPLVAISLRVPANYKDETFSEPQLGHGADDPAVLKWRQKKLDRTATAALRQTRSFGGPLQIIEAEFDERIPHQTVQNYVDAVADTSKLDYHLMKGWTHGLGLDKKRNGDYQRILLNWLNQKV